MDDATTASNPVNPHSRVCGGVDLGAEYDAEQVAFLRAVDAWRSQHRRIPRTTDYLAIAHALGYRRVTTDPV